MEKVGILVVSYGARAVAMVDAFVRSPNYNVKIYVQTSRKIPSMQKWRLNKQLFQT